MTASGKGGKYSHSLKKERWESLKKTKSSLWGFNERSGAPRSAEKEKSTQGVNKLR